MHLPAFLARRFVAGASLEEALPAIRRLADRGMFVSLDLLGEQITSREIAGRATEAYLKMLGPIAEERRDRGMDVGISVKLSMMGQHIDEEYCLENLLRLLAEAKARNLFVRLDMEGSDTTESTLSLFERTYPDYPDHVGVVLQAYLKRTRRDVDRMCDLNARVRICKGAYREPPEVAHQDMRVIRDRFMEYACTLLERSRYPGIATHDDRLIEATKAFVEARGIDRKRFEFQMLYGIRPKTWQQLVREGYNMRIYTPFGTEWVPYFGRRLRERKENVWFVFRNVFRK